MPRQRLRTVTVLTEDGSAVLVSPDEDLPPGVKDGDINERAFEPWPGEEEVEHDLSGLEYDDMTAKELASEVKNRGLEPTSQKKADLITALEEDDASH
jgi:hypothetical protein